MKKKGIALYSIALASTVLFQLALHGSDERMYAIMGGNDGRIVFLTTPQYECIYKHVEPKEKPLEIKEWWQENT